MVSGSFPTACGGTRIKPPWAVASAVQVSLAAATWVIILSVQLAKTQDALTPYDGEIVNGLFQLISPIRRSLGGYALGADFVVFHGPLWHVPYLPIYALAGGNAAVLASFVVAANFGFLVLGIALVTRSLVSAGWFFATTVACATVVLIGAGFNWAGFSNIGQRSAVPLALIGLAVVQQRRTSPLRFFLPVMSGAVLGLAIDTGLQALGAMAVAAYFAESLRRQSLRHRIVAALSVSALPLLWLWVILLVSLSQFRMAAATSALAFGLRDVPSDQRWFFGTWPQAELPSLLDLPRLLPMNLLIALAAALVGTASSIWQRDDALHAEGAPSRFGVLSLILLPVLGFVPVLGGIAAFHYAQPGFAAFAVLLGLLVVSRRKNHTYARRQVASIILGTSALAVLGLAVSQIPTVTRASANIESFSPRLLPPPSTVAAIAAECERFGPEAGIWSQYPNVLHILSGCSNPGGDLLIHNVGSRRLDALEQVQEARPLFVETLRSDVHPWEAWLQSTHAEGYLYLWRNYSPADLLAESVLWRRRETPINLEIQTIDYFVPTGSRILEISPPLGSTREDFIGIATVRYQIQQPFGMIPVVGSLNHFGLWLPNAPYPNEFVSLNPKRQSQSFFLYSRCGEPQQLIAERRGQQTLDSIVIYDITVEWVRHPSDAESEPTWRHIFGNPARQECSNPTEDQLR